MAIEGCFFNKCHGPPKWNHYGIATKDAVTYSKLLGQKRGFQEFIELNDLQISKSGKIDSYCIIDKKYSSSKGSKLDIYIFDEEEHQSALYLEYSVHKQCIIKNCNNLITFFNFNNNSSIHLQDSFIYVESAARFKWVLFFSVLEFLIKNLNMSIIGSRFYFPLFSKYLIMNELRLLLLLQNCLNSFSHIHETFTLSLKNNMLCGASHSASSFQDPKNNPSFLSEKAVRRMKNLSSDTCKSNQKLQLKRKSVDSFSEVGCSPKTKRCNYDKNVCHCQNYTWKIFKPFQKATILNYTSILEAKSWSDAPEPRMVFPVDSQTDCLHNSNPYSLHQNQSSLNNNLFPPLNTSKKPSPVQLLNKVIALKSITDLSLEKDEEKQPKSGIKSDLQTSKEMGLPSDDRENITLDNLNNFKFSALECEKEESKNEKTYPRATTTDKIEKNIAGPSGEYKQMAGFIGIEKLSVTFQTASGKSLKVSETALKAAEKMFEDVSSENAEFFPEKKSQSAIQMKSIVSNKQCVGFQTASGKSLHASQTALEAAERMFKEINVEEKDVFPDRLSQKKNNKEYYPNLKDSVDDDLSKVLAENFFEDIPFDEKEIDSKSADGFMTSNIQKPEVTKTHKIRKSLGGRRSLKPYSSKK